MQIDSYLSPCIKLKSKCIKDLNISPVTLNLIDEKVRNNLECIGTTDNFLNRTLVAQRLRLTTHKWNLVNPKSFCKANDSVNKIKWQPTEKEKIFTNPTSEKGLISKVYKEFKEPDSNK
ncbi:hypothetical protein STEG23_024272 [Scotinomys teguina]